MRIGIDIRELEKGKMTGMGRVTLNFLNFVNSNDAENEYVLFGNQKTKEMNFSRHIKTKIIPEFCKPYWDQIVLSNQIKKEKLDIFFSPSYAGPVFSQEKLLVTCHDLHFLMFNKDLIMTWLRRYYCRIIWKRAVCILAISEYSKKQAIEFLGCDPQRLKVVNASVEDKFRQIDKSVSFDKISKWPGIDKDFILYVGNLNPHKNLNRLVEAYGLLPRNLIVKYQLVIAGRKDKDYAALLNFVKHCNLLGNVTFLDLVNDDDLVFLYNAATVFALASLREGFGLPALEAMACGTPVIVSNTTALPEVVGEAGLYVNPLDAGDISRKIEKLLSDEKLRKELSLKGLEQAKKFKPEKTAVRILEIFKGIFNTKKYAIRSN